MKNIRQFEIVAEIARQGSISKAADAMKISQPTLSKLLRKTEDELGLELFDRSSIPLRLTTAGICYLDTGNRIIDLEHGLQKQLEKIKNNSLRDLRVGISPSRAPYILPKIMRVYREKCPGVKVVASDGNTAVLNDALLRGELDIIISLLNDSTKAFRAVPLFDETTLLAAPRSMECLSAQQILETQPLISIGNGLRMWRALMLILETLERPGPEFECTSIESAFSLVKSGFGAMLVPSYLADSERESEKVIFYRLPKHYEEAFGNELQRKVCLFYRSDAFLSTSEEQFIAACKEISIQDRGNLSSK